MLRFSIRDLLLFTVIAALSLAWWGDRSRLAVKVRERDTWELRADGAKEIAVFAGCEISWDEDGVSGELPRGAHYHRSANGAITYLDP
jgi:hypothetical protein